MNITEDYDFSFHLGWKLYISKEKEVSVIQSAVLFKDQTKAE